jgi:predicted phosphodiesterase
MNPASEKILVVADIHGNGPALAAVLGAEADATRVLCLGDLATYGPDPVECLRWAKANLNPGDLVLGNHDRLLLTEEPVDQGRPRVATEILLHARRKLMRPDLSFLRNLPVASDVVVAELRWHLVHALPSDPLWGLLHPEAGPKRWRLELALAGFPDVLLVAHTHRPFLMDSGGCLVVNPGSVGRPKDGDSRASYAVWEDGRFTLKRISYRIEETVAGLSREFEGELLERLAGTLRRGGRDFLDLERAA